MKKVLHHPFRSIGAALTLTGAALVFVVLVLPAIALGGRGAGKNAIYWYENESGNRIKQAEIDPGGTADSPNQHLDIVGKNLDHASTVYCWDGSDFVVVDDWSTGPTSKRIIDVDPADACLGESRIMITFSNGTPTEVIGPKITFV